MYQFKTIVLSLIFLFPIIVNAQSNVLPKVAEEKIDSLFSEWDSNEKPGMAVAILEKGKVIYKKEFGQADLKHNIPITSTSQFQIGWMSKQFTAFAILLLEEQGKLSLDDDIRKYLPEMPKFEYTIRIKHLLSQTSGLSGFGPLKALLGWQEGDLITNEEIIQLTTKQKDLDYKPGEDFSFTNTEIILLTEIVARVSKQSFVAFTKENIFEPLQMKNTFFCDDYEMMFNNRAESYQIDGDGYQKATLNSLVVGLTNLYTSIDDLCIWERNFKFPKIGSALLIKKMNQATTLDNGKYFTPSFGQLTFGQQFIHGERGLDKIYLTGSAGGYTSSIFKFLKHELTVIVLSNSGIPYNGYLGMQTAYLFLEDQFTEPASFDFDKMVAAPISTKKLESYMGHYWNQQGSYARKIYLENDTLRYGRIGQNRNSDLIALSQNSFQMIIGGDEKIIVSFEDKGKDKLMIVTIGNSDPIISSAYDPKAYTSDELQEFAGSFFCKAVGTAYQFSVKDDQLIASHIRNGNIVFSAVMADQFSSNTWFMRNIEFERDKQNKIKGFRLATDEIRNLVFVKIPETNKLY